MARRASDRPTEAEVEILRVFWERGPSTVREVNQAVSEIRPTGYTTTLKLMQIMLDKGLLRRDVSKRPQVYEAAISREQAQGQFVRDLLHRVFDGSASQFVLQVLSAAKARPKDVAEMRRLLDKLQKGK